MTPAKALLFLACTIVIYLIAWTVALSVWEECRSYGHSWLYCVRLVAR